MAAIDLREQHRRATAAFDRTLSGVDDDQWAGPTPCSAWDVRALAAHLVDEALWTPPLLAGATIAATAPTIPADPLGTDPVAAWARAAPAASAAVAAADLDGTVHLSYGDEVAAEYLQQLTTDLVVHAWDLARATGQDESVELDLLAGRAEYFDDATEAAWRAGGVIGAPAPVGDAAAPAHALLARFGRDPSPDATLAVLVRFNAAFARRDVDAVMAQMTDDCVFESTTPPDGERHEGSGAVRAAWEALFAASPSARFETEEGIVAGDRATYRWVYRWGEGDDHVRGIDVFRVRDGLVAEKLSYVKG